MEVRKRRSRRKSWFKGRLQIFLLVVSVIAGLFVGSLVHQMLNFGGALDAKFGRSPEQTWRSRKTFFESRSTTIVTPTFLAALLHVGGSDEVSPGLLHLQTERLINKYNLKRDLREKQNLAAVIHLCGVERAEELARSGLRFSRAGSCRGRNALTYVKQVQNAQREMRRLN